MNQTIGTICIVLCFVMSQLSIPLSLKSSISVSIYITHSKPAKPRQGLRSPDFFHFFITFRNDVMRSFLRFIIGLREVLPHDADAKQLNRADENDHTHGGCPAGDRITEAQASDNDDDQHNRCHECHPYPRPGCNTVYSRGLAPMSYTSSYFIPRAWPSQVLGRPLSSLPPTRSTSPQKVL